MVVQTIDPCEEPIGVSTMCKKHVLYTCMYMCTCISLYIIIRVTITSVAVVLQFVT